MAYLRRRSKNPRRKLQSEVDAGLQNWFRANYSNYKCEGCGAPFELMHHHVEKSKSNAGRYYHPNLIFLCKKCHNKIHFHDHQVVAIYSTKRGKKWVEEMDKLRQKKTPAFSIKQLLKIKKRYESILP